VGFLGDLFGGMTDLFGSHPGAEYSGLYKQLADKYGGLANQYQGMQPNLPAQQMGFDIPTRSAQLGAMGQLGDIANQGGLDAIGRSQIAEANASTSQQADQMANAIQQRAGSGPARNSGVTMSLMQGAGQNAADRNYLGGLGVAGGAQQRQLGALGRYADVAGQAGGQADAISEFNARLRQGTNEGNFQRRMQQLGGVGEAYGGMGQAYSGGFGAGRYDQEQTRRGFQGIGNGLYGAGKQLFGPTPLDDFTGVGASPY
jgi:hypothetical protein